MPSPTKVSSLVPGTTIESDEGVVRALRNFTESLHRFESNVSRLTSRIQQARSRTLQTPAVRFGMPIIKFARSRPGTLIAVASLVGIFWLISNLKLFKPRDSAR